MAIDSQKAWDNFAPFESGTTIPAGQLVALAGIQPGEIGLDVGCGTGVVAVTAARNGASMTGLDPSEGLLTRAKENGTIAGVEIRWLSGSAEELPFEPSTFDVVLSQFGHIFAPNAQLAIDEMLRVLKPGGRLAVSVWDAEHFTGHLWSLLAAHGLEDFDNPILWGKAEERLRLFAGRLTDVRDTPGILNTPCLSPAHTYFAMSRALWPMAVLVDKLSADPVALEAFHHEALALISRSEDRNVIPQRYTTVVGRKL